ncbi:unnamed protein product [Merluccius merluccius]
MDDPETELVSSEPDALGAEFITVELDTQPIEYVVKWAEVGSKFTISCVKKDSDDPNELAPDQLKFETDETFFAPYEEVYPCELTEQSVEIKMDSDSGEEEEEGEDGEGGGEEEEEEEEGETTAEEEEEEEEAGSSQPDGEGDGDSDQVDYEPHQRQYRCNYCGKCYSHASSLYRHQQMHAGKGTYSPMAAAAAAAANESRYACPHCGMSFKGSRMLGSHLRLHGKRRIHPCNICGKEFNHSSSLSRHRLVHKKDKGGGGGGGGAKDGLGPNAGHHHRRRRRGAMKAGGGGGGGAKGKKGRRQRQLSSPETHEAKQAGQMVQVPGGEKFYACPQCDMTFRTSTMLSKHQVSHVKDLLDNYTPGKENLGETSSDLKIRLKLCSRDKPNFYTLCKKNRRRRGGGGGGGGGGRGGKRGPAAAAAAAAGAAGPLVGAMGPAGSEEEEEEEEYQQPGGAHGCGLCDKSFSHASGLARHQQAHRGGPGARGKAFHQRAQFHRKRGSAHAGKVYACAACDKTFMHSSSYSRHKKAHMQQQQQQGPGHERPPKRRKRGAVDETAPLESDSE